MGVMTRPFAIVTGASTGIGYELARQCVANGFDLLILLIAADEPAIHGTARELRDLGAAVSAVELDLATLEGVDELYAATDGRPVDALLANAGHGLGGAGRSRATCRARFTRSTTARKRSSTPSRSRCVPN